MGPEGAFLGASFCEWEPLDCTGSTNNRRGMSLSGMFSSAFVTEIGFQLDYLHSLFLHKTFQSDQFVLQSVIHRMGLRGLVIELFIDPKLPGLLFFNQV